MKAIKHTIKIEIEVMDEAGVPGLLQKMVQEWEDEVRNGEFVYRDGDRIQWAEQLKPVEL